jgi:uncharacterized damage-inducible protein DinB
MPDRSALYADLARAYDGEPWHGPSLLALLGDVDAGMAAARPIEGGHTIMELVLHMAAWTGEVARRLRGSTPALPPEGDWPPPVEGEDGWAQARDRLAIAQADALAALAACPEERLTAIVGQTRDPSVGSGLTYAAMASGLAQHHAYHGGQIGLLKRAMVRASK